MKKGVSILVMLLFLGLAGAVQYLDDVNTEISNKTLDFSISRTLDTNINLPGNAFVLDAMIEFYGDLSEWEVLYFYNTSITSPVDANYIANNKWLISDTDTGIHLINPQDGSTYDSFNTANDIYDATYITDSKWLYVDYTNKKIVLFNSSSDTEISSYAGLNNPEGAFYVSDNKWLIADTGADIVRLIDGGIETKNFSTNIKQPNDVYYLSDEEWLLTSKDGSPFWLSGKVVHINSTSGSVIKQYSGLSSSIRSIDIAFSGSDEYWLISDSSAGVFLVNMTSGSAVFPSNVISSYTSTNAAYDAEYIDLNDWLITDKDGVKRVQEVKKFYPTNPTIDVTGDGDIEWSFDDELNKSETFNYSNFTSELNDYLESVPDDLTTHSIPLRFHSDTSGVIEITAMNITYNHKPSVTVTYPNGNEFLSGIQEINWTYSDNDNDQIFVSVYYANSSLEWNFINSSINITAQDLDTTLLEDGQYTALVIINDSINEANDTSDTFFTIDNTNPELILIIYPRYFRDDNVTIRANSTDTNLDYINVLIECPDTSTNFTLTNISANEYQGTWSPSTSNMPGTCTVTANATDRAGNTNSTIDTFILKYKLGLTLNLSNTNPSSGELVTVTGYLDNDTGVKVGDWNITLTYPGGTKNILTSSSGYYETNFTASTAGTVSVSTTAWNETFTNSTSITIYSGGGGSGGGGGGSVRAICGDLVCELRGGETCLSCPKDCGECPITGSWMSDMDLRYNESDANSGTDDSSFKNKTFIGKEDTLPEQPEEAEQPAPAVGSAFEVFTEYLKSPITLATFIAIIAIITILLLSGWKKKKTKKFLSEFGD
ncbi:hypothetical protein KY330_00265 [Candidatus Woesearchaeota archaeon]|nr:hypothetical protein [Candidatus Woesearchaeota archaeon]